MTGTVEIGGVLYSRAPHTCHDRECRAREAAGKSCPWCWGGFPRKVVACVMCGADAVRTGAAGDTLCGTCSSDFDVCVDPACELGQELAPLAEHCYISEGCTGTLFRDEDGVVRPKVEEVEG